MSLDVHRGSAWAFHVLMQQAADEIASGKRKGATRLWLRAHPPKVRIVREWWTAQTRKRA